MLRPFLLAIASLVSFVAAPLLAQAPRPVMAGDRLTFVGLPAIAADGTLVAVVEPFESSSEAQRLAVQLLRIADGAITDRWLLDERDDSGRRRAAPDDARGTTPWRRASNLADHLESLGFRSLVPIDPSDRDATVRVRRSRHHLTLTRRGGTRASSMLPSMPAFCGMSDEAPHDVPPEVQRIWSAPRSDVVLVEYGHVYASCMCPADLAYLAVSVPR